MSRYDNINDAALWASILEIQAKLELDFRAAAKVRKLTNFGDLILPFRRMHWAASFIGIPDFADIAAGGAAFALQLQDSGYKWSQELAKAMAIVIRRTRAFCDARPEEPSAGVFVDGNQSVLPGPELKRPVRVDDILDTFRRRQIRITEVSACKQRGFSRDPNFSHAITVPKYDKSRHRADRNLSLVYLNLAKNRSVDELISLFEEAWKDNAILLHGPLAIPWEKHKSYPNQRPYFLLLDSTGDAGDWLKSHGLSGEVIRVLKEAEKAPAVESALPARTTEIAPIKETRIIFRDRTPEPEEDLEYLDTDVDELLEQIPEKIPHSRSASGERKDEFIKMGVNTKLIMIVSAILVLALGVTTAVGVLRFRNNLITRLEINSTSMSSIVAKQADNELLKIISSGNLLFQVGAAEGGRNLVDDFFANDPNLIYVGIPETDYQFFSQTWFLQNRVFDIEIVLNGILDARREDLEKASNGETVIVNISPLFPNLESPVVAIAVPFLLGNKQESMVILADIGETLVESVRLQQGGASTSIVNPGGEILADPNLMRVFDGDNISGTRPYEVMYTDGLPFGIVEYTEETESGTERYLAYYKLIEGFNLGVITTVQRSEAFADVGAMIRTNLWFGLAIMLLSILGIRFFAHTLTIPITRLHTATWNIYDQDWDNARVKPRYRDEIGALSNNFNRMIPNLQATSWLFEQTKAFVNPDVAQMIKDNDEELNVRKKRDVTVFFSDVRNFTEMSENMGDPNLVLENLSEYFSRMVPCVLRTKGTTDKFIGDALMAVWGSMKKRVPNHAEAGIEAALMMRAELVKFNENRDPEDPEYPPFRIGCGLHSGEATVGLMGSKDKQEWAHMGSTVNTAARIETVTSKEMVDILISPETASRVKGLYDLAPTDYAYRLKGLPGENHLLVVLGRMDDPDRPRTVGDLREGLGWPRKITQGKSSDKVSAVTG